MLQEGEQAPDFALKDKEGKIWSLKDFNQECNVIYFYPKDSTPGCTLEAIEFTSKIGEFVKLGASVVGISGGNEKSKQKFCTSHNIKVLLLSDEDFKTSQKFGVYTQKSFMGRKYMGIERTTFVLDRNKKVLCVFSNVKPKDHAEQVLDYIRRFKK